MLYPFSQFCADIKFDIRSDNIFDIKLGDSLHVNHTINFVIKSDIKFDISTKLTTWIGHKFDHQIIFGCKM